MAVLCIACLLQAFQRDINCTVLKDQFEWSQDALSKGELMFGFKNDKPEAQPSKTSNPTLNTTAHFGRNTTAQDQSRIQATDHP